MDDKHQVEQHAELFGVPSPNASAREFVEEFRREQLVRTPTLDEAQVAATALKFQIPWEDEQRRNYIATIQRFLLSLDSRPPEGR